MLNMQMDFSSKFCSYILLFINFYAILQNIGKKNKQSECCLYALISNQEWGGGANGYDINNNSNYRINDRNNDKFSLTMYNIHTMG